MNKVDIINNCNEIYFNTVTSERKGLTYEYKDSRTKIINGIPHVWPIGISNSQVYIVCPICGKFHVHGLANGKYEGYRVPHCLSHELNKTYYIERLYKCIGVK